MITDWIPCNDEIQNLCIAFPTDHKKSFERRGPPEVRSGHLGVQWRDKRIFILLEMGVCRLIYDVIDFLSIITVLSLDSFLVPDLLMIVSCSRFCAIL